MADEATKEILRVRFAFASRYKAFLALEAAEPLDVLSRERDLIQLFALSWVRILFHLGAGKPAAMLVDYFQKVMADTVTPQGLKRPVIMGAGQTLLEEEPKHPQRQAAYRLLQEGDSRLAEIIMPPGEEGILYPVSIILYLQLLIRGLSDASLFYLMLVMGGVLEYYENGGKTDDLKALAEAPAYAFEAAQKYIDEERRRTGATPPQTDK